MAMAEVSGASCEAHGVGRPADVCQLSTTVMGAGIAWTSSMMRALVAATVTDLARRRAAGQTFVMAER